MNKNPALIKKIYAMLLSAFLCGLAIWIFPVFCNALPALAAGVLHGDFVKQAQYFRGTIMERYTENEGWIDYYGLSQRLIGKHELNNFDVIKDNAGYLYMRDEVQTEESIEQTLNTNATLFRHAESLGIPYLFVQVPYKNYDSIEELSEYLPAATKSQDDAVCHGIEALGIPTLDLRETLTGYTYYRTDHHWNTETAFAAFRLVCDRLNEQWDLGLDKDGQLTDVNQYEEVVYEDCFLGSLGIRTGAYFTGKDDFALFYPKFKTDIEYRHYDAEGMLTDTFCGSFADAFIDKAILEDEHYFNKYNANLHGGYIENIILNKESENGLKALFLSHSYGRSMVQYFSLLFAETRYLDPQAGRYTGNLIAYVDAYQPDVIVCMYNNPLCVE